MDDVCGVHVIDGAEELIKDELDHLLSQRDLLRMDESMEGVVHILHAEVNLIKTTHFFRLDAHHVLQPHNVLVLQKL